jgi:hypothetical protein
MLDITACIATLLSSRNEINYSKNYYWKNITNYYGVIAQLYIIKGLFDVYTHNLYLFVFECPMLILDIDTFIF